MKRNKALIINDAVCGILLLVSLLVFIIYGIVTDSWHPIWVVIPCTGLVCGIITIITNTCVKLSNKEEKTESKSKSKKI